MPKPKSQPKKQQPAAKSGKDDSRPADDSALLERIEALEQRAAAAEESLLRTEADARNSIRRAEQDSARARQYALEPLVSDLLPSIDNLERALAAAKEQDGDNESAATAGISLCLKVLLDCLERHHLSRVDASGDFDPDVHEAVGTCASELPQGQVVELVQNGYRLHQRLVRPARVLVSKGPAEAGP